MNNHQCNTNENHQCDSLLKNIDESFYTPAMKYVIDNKSEPPKWMRHDPEIVDRFGETMAHRWVQHVVLYQRLHKERNINETNDEDSFMKKNILTENLILINFQIVKLLLKDSLMFRIG